MSTFQIQILLFFIVLSSFMIFLYVKNIYSKKSLVLSIDTDNLLDDNDSQRVGDKILIAMEEDKYYLKKIVTIREFSCFIGENSSLVAKVIECRYSLSFNQLLTKYRIDDACDILMDASSVNISLNEIAEIVGYQSYHIFVDEFLKIKNKYPQDFRC